MQSDYEINRDRIFICLLKLLGGVHTYMHDGALNLPLIFMK